MTPNSLGPLPSLGLAQARTIRSCSVKTANHDTPKEPPPKGGLGPLSATGEYVSDRFGRALSGLPVEMRREAVRELTEAGLSTRAIAPVVGVTQKTIVKDTQALRGDTSVSPDTSYLPDVTTGGEVTPAAPAVTGQGATGVNPVNTSPDYPSTDVTTGGEVTPAAPAGLRAVAPAPRQAAGARGVPGRRGHVHSGHRPDRRHQ